MRAAKRHRVCVTPCAKGFNATVFHYNHSMRQGRQARHTYLTQRSYGVSREAVRDV